MPRTVAVGFLLSTMGCAPDSGGPGEAGDLVAHDRDAFFRVVPRDAELERLATGMPYVEGPVWLPDEGVLVFSSMQEDELKRWHPEEGLGTFRANSGRANGNALDREGRLVTCEHATRRVSRTLADGTVETLVDRYEGRRLSSPNDVVVARDGAIWFTDPPYGLEREPRELDGNYVFRFDPQAGELRIVVAPDFDLPNGIAFAPDGMTRYVTDSGAPRTVSAFEPSTDLAPLHEPWAEPSGEYYLTNPRVLHRLPLDGWRGEPDGLAIAADGTLFVAVGDGVDVLTPEGAWLGIIRVPEAVRPVRNVCFGGRNGRTLFLTAGDALCSIELLVSGS